MRVPTAQWFHSIRFLSISIAPFSFFPPSLLAPPPSPPIVSVRLVIVVGVVSVVARKKHIDSSIASATLLSPHNDYYLITTNMIEFYNSFATSRRILKNQIWKNGNRQFDHIFECYGGIIKDIWLKRTDCYFIWRPGNAGVDWQLG